MSKPLFQFYMKKKLQKKKETRIYLNVWKQHYKCVTTDTLQNNIFLYDLNRLRKKKINFFITNK